MENVTNEGHFVILDTVMWSQIKSIRTDKEHWEGEWERTEHQCFSHSDREERDASTGQGRILFGKGRLSLNGKAWLIWAPQLSLSLLRSSKSPWPDCVFTKPHLNLRWSSEVRLPTEQRMCWPAFLRAYCQLYFTEWMNNAASGFSLVGSVWVSLFNKYLLSAVYVPGIGRSPCDIDKIPVLTECTHWWGGDTKKMNKSIDKFKPC